MTANNNIGNFHGTTFRQRIRPLLLMMKVIGLYREGHMCYMILSLVYIVIMSLGMVKISLVMVDVQPGLKILFLWMLTGFTGVTENILIMIVYFYHNIKGTVVSICLKMEAAMNSLKYTVSKRITTYLIILIVGCWLSTIAIPTFCLILGYLGGRDLRRFFLFPGGNGVYVIDALVFIVNGSVMVVFEFFTIFILLLMITMGSLFKHLRLSLDADLVRGVITAELLENYRGKFNSLCELLREIDRLISPCLGITLPTQTASLIFLAYSAVFLDKESISDIDIDLPMAYISISIFIVMSISVMSIFAITGAWLNHQVIYMKIPHHNWQPQE